MKVIHTTDLSREANCYAFGGEENCPLIHSELLDEAILKREDNNETLD